MSAQPSQSSETYTRYREADGSDQESEKDRNTAGRRGSRSEPQPSSSQQLLQEVLGETLIRNQENTQQLVDQLRCFRREHAGESCDLELFVAIAREVLRHRLGVRSRKLPDELYDEVGRALWSNEHSRKRVEGLWEKLGTSQ